MRGVPPRPFSEFELEGAAGIISRLSTRFPMLTTAHVRNAHASVEFQLEEALGKRRVDLALCAATVEKRQEEARTTKETSSFAAAPQSKTLARHAAPSLLGLEHFNK